MLSIRCSRSDEVQDVKSSDTTSKWAKSLTVFAGPVSTCTKETIAAQASPISSNLQRPLRANHPTSERRTRMPEPIQAAAAASSTTSAAASVTMPVAEKALEVHRRLCLQYGCPLRYFHTIDPMSELVASLLSHRTLNRDSGLAFRALRKRFPDWAAVRDAPVGEVQDAIAPCTWPEQKAPRLQAVLREVSGREEAMVDRLRWRPMKES